MVSPEISRQPHAPPNSASMIDVQSSTSSSSSSSSTSRFVTKDLGPNDVLLGRGTGPNEQVGNIRFRALVREVIQAFGTKGFDGKEKTRLAKSVIEEVKAKGGRFVRKIEWGGSPDTKKTNPKSGDYYEEVTDALALDKTKQSFRHQLRGTKASSLYTGGVRSENHNDELDKMKQGGHQKPVNGNVVLRGRSLSMSSSGGAGGPPSPSQRSTSSAPGAFLTEGIRKLKTLQHGRMDRSPLVSSSVTPAQSFLDPFLLMGLRNSLLSCTSSSELMRKELASRYLLAESILLGGGDIIEQALLAQSQHLRRGGREQQGLLSSTSSPLPQVGILQNSYGSVRSNPIYSTTPVTPSNNMESFPPRALENVRARHSPPRSFAADNSSSSKTDRFYNLAHVRR